MKNYSDDKKLLESLKTGDENALEYIFKKYFPRLRNYALGFTQDEDIAKDIVQECFMRLWEKRSLLNSLSLSSLLFTMVRNGCLNHLKHRAVVEKHRITYSATIRGEEKLYNLDFELESGKQNLFEELQAQIGVVMETLPVRTREIFTLSRFEGLKNREIAAQLQISTTAVEKHISRAIKTFSRYFREKYPTDTYIILLVWVLANQL